MHRLNCVRLTTVVYRDIFKISFILCLVCIYILYLYTFVRALIIYEQSVCGGASQRKMNLIIFTSKKENIRIVHLAPSSRFFFLLCFARAKTFTEQNKKKN